MIPVDALVELATLGLSRDQAEAVSLMLRAVEDATRAEGNDAIEARRKNDRERKDRQRHVKSREVTGRDVKARDTSPLKEAPHTPQENTPPISLSSLRSESEPRAERALVAQEIADEFSKQFWPAWPHKVGKPDAAKSFLRARRQGAACDEILAGVERYIRDKPADRPWLNPSTFLNQERWKDDPAPQSNARAGPARGGNGFAALAVELARNDREQHQQTGRNFEAVPLLPGGVSEPGPGAGGDDDNGLRRNGVDLLVGHGFRRM